MGFFDLFKDENQKETREVNRMADTEFADEDTEIASNEDTEFALDKNTEFAGDEITIRLHEEELDIHKDRVRTGEIVLHKDVIEEQQTVNVPVSHDQVVIERRSLDHVPSNESITEETIRIPVSADKVEVSKHTVVTGEISVHKREVQETEQVQDVIHREVADVENKGDTDIIDEASETNTLD